jgi:hypothetical protein
VATPGRGSIAARRENGGGDVAQPGDCSPRLGQQWGGGASVVTRAQQRGGGDNLMVW